MLSANIAQRLTLSLCLTALLPYSKFTNVQCNNLDENYATFVLCRLRAIKRDVNEVTIKWKMQQTPTAAANLTMRLQLLKKASGYKPFLYDVSTDVCEYLEKRNHPFLNIIFNAFGNYSSGVHRCPLSQQISIENLPFPVKSLQALPLPTGEYALFGTLIAEKIERAIVKLYFMLADF